MRGSRRPPRSHQGRRVKFRVTATPIVAVWARPGGAVRVRSLAAAASACLERLPTPAAPPRPMCQKPKAGGPPEPAAEQALRRRPYDVAWA